MLLEGHMYNMPGIMCKLVVYYFNMSGIKRRQ